MNGKKRVVIVDDSESFCRSWMAKNSWSSPWPAEDLHEIFPMGACLAVINKEDPPQQEAFLMIVESLLREPPGSPRGSERSGEL